MKEKIEEILNKYLTKHPDNDNWGVVIYPTDLSKELLTLIEQEKREAVEGFVAYTTLGFTNDEEDFIINGNELKQNIDEYLKQLDKEKYGKTI